MVLPAPGSPAITLTERTGNPPPRMRSRAALPVERHGGGDARRSIRLLGPPDQPAGAQLGDLLEPVDDDGARQLGEQPAISATSARNATCARASAVCVVVCDQAGGSV